MAQGRTLHEYEKTYQAYLTESTLADTARTAGVSLQTAGRYVKQGVPSLGLEPIKDRVAREVMLRVEDAERNRRRAIDAHSQVSLALLMQHVKGVKKVGDVVPDGTVLPDGTIAVNEKTFSTLVRSSKDLLTYADEVKRAIAGGPVSLQNQNNVAVNVNVAASAVSSGGPGPLSDTDVFGIALEFAQEHKALLLNDSSVESATIGILAAEARLRKGTSSFQHTNEALEEE